MGKYWDRFLIDIAIDFFVELLDLFFIGKSIQILANSRIEFHPHMER